MATGLSVLSVESSPNKVDWFFTRAPNKSEKILRGAKKRIEVEWKVRIKIIIKGKVS